MSGFRPRHGHSRDLYAGLQLVEIRADDLRFRLTDQAREFGELVHEPIRDPAQPRAILNRYVLGDVLFPFGQHPLVVYFKSEARLETWKEFYTRFALGQHPFTAVFDFGNVLSEQSDQALLGLYQEMSRDNQYNFGIVSYVRDGSWS